MLQMKHSIGAGEKPSELFVDRIRLCLEGQVGCRNAAVWHASQGAHHSLSLNCLPNMLNLLLSIFLQLVHMGCEEVECQHTCHSLGRCEQSPRHGHLHLLGG